MAYLGRGLDKISNIEVLDNITFDGSSSYSITKGSVAFTPNSAQSLLISIDGVVQATNFTVSSSTIDFGVAIPSTSVCNFFLHYGTGVMTVPSDGSVTTAKLGDDAVTGAKLSKPFNYDSGTFYIDDTNNRVGIGITSPVRDLHIHGADSDTHQLHITNSTTGATSNDGVSFALGSDESLIINQREANNIRLLTNDTERMRITSSGQVLVNGTTAQGSGKLQSHCGTSDYCSAMYSIQNQADYIEFINDGGQVGSIRRFGGSGVSYNTTSDYRLKENVVDIENATTRLKQLKPKRFNFITDADTTVDGFLAHEVQTVVPEAIHGTHNEVDADGNPKYQGIDQSKLVPLLVKTIQELEARITALENE